MVSISSAQAHEAAGPNDRPLRILRVIASANPAGGGPIEGLRRSSEAMAQAGHHTEVVTLDPPGAPYLDDFPLPVHACGATGKRPGGYSAALPAWIAAEGSRFDAAVLHGLWHASSIGGYRGVKRAGLPYLIFTHGMMDPWFRQAYPLKHWKKQAFWTLFQGRVLRDAHRVLFTTEEEMLRAQGSFLGFPFTGRTVAYGAPDLPDAADRQAEAFARALPELGGKPYLLYLSRIHEKKGCDLLVEAFAREAAQDPDLQLVIAGPDAHEMIPKLRSRAQELGIDDRLHWPGMLKGDEKYGAFRGAEAFILPSHQENFGIVVAEALAAGLPVLTTDKVNTWREVVGGKAGFVAPDTLEGTREILHKWLALTPEEKVAMRQAARETYERHYMISEAGRDLAAALKEAIDEQ